jgi:hypothetical protein
MASQDTSGRLAHYARSWLDGPFSGLLALALLTKIGCMNLKAALHPAAAAGAVLLVAACGGGGSDLNGGSAGGSIVSSSGNCQPQAPTTVAGGDLFVAQQGPVGLTLLSNDGLSQYEFTLYYDNVFGMPTNNPQDKWGQARPFAPGTPVGTSTQLQPEPPTPDLIQWQPLPSTYPKGIPVELLLTRRDGNPPASANSSSTASIGKDLRGHDVWHTAVVTYATNHTASVTFFPTGDGAGFTVGLTNVFGSGAPTGSDGGC